MSKIVLPAWYGEFGWEVMSWAPFCRKLAKGHDQVIVTSFEGMGPLYADFATEFKTHGQPHRSLEYPKGFEQYRPAGIYYRYGRPEKSLVRFDVLLHGRGIGRKNSINYRRWDELTEVLKKLPLSFSCIGSTEDLKIKDCAFDMRRIELQKLLDLIARSSLVVGASSGVMHLAAACGTNIVCWGDTKTRYRETLEQRYKVTWNPFNVKVGWIDADDWQPEPMRILKAIKEIL
jgi:hypothetical protein